MRKMLFGIVLSLVALPGCGGGGQNQAEIDACVERGVAYFKEIGSYPTLTAPMYEGRNAEDEARARCNRTTTAF